MSASEVLYSVRGPKSWTTMTSHELADQPRGTDVAMVPVGATEQHAGHLPLGQDNFEIEEVVRRAVLKRHCYDDTTPRHHCPLRPP
jgi:creatinine amidohydrolase